MKQLSLLILMLSICQIKSQFQKSFYTGGGCSEIPGIGSPILMISNAHKYIEDALNVRNKYTVLKYIFFVSIPSTLVPGQTTYKFAFSLTDYNGTKYIGVELVVSPFGIGSIKINKFLVTASFAALKQLIDNTITDTTTYQCGDLKFVYSSFGNDPTPELEYVFPGRNQNSAGLAILNQLNKTTGQPAITKNCVTSHFIKSSGFFGAPGAGTPTDLIRCIPNKRGVAGISIGCTANTVANLRLIFNNFGDNGTTQSILVGNPATPASDITLIDLQAADKISITSTTTPNTINIKTLDKNNIVLTNYTCGTGTLSPQNIIANIDDFLGLADIYTNGTIIQGFEVAQYED